MPEYLTTKELAELLRIRERKVYDLAASGSVPCSRATGKLLFPRKAVNDWLSSNSSGLEPANPRQRPNVILGSHDPLLEWAIRESRCGIATFLDGSMDGLKRFAGQEGIATGLHIHDTGNNDWNKAAVRDVLGFGPYVLVEWARRQRGLITSKESGKNIHTMADLKGRRVAPRQEEAGSELLFRQLLLDYQLHARDIEFISAARSENDAALAILENKADASFGLACLAEQYRLPFIPVIEERFDLLVERRAWFEPPMQALLEFCRTETFRCRALELAGYQIAGLGQVHLNL